MMMMMFPILRIFPFHSHLAQARTEKLGAVIDHLLGAGAVDVMGPAEHWNVNETHRKSNRNMGKSWENHRKTHGKLEIVPFGQRLIT